MEGAGAGGECSDRCRYERRGAAVSTAGGGAVGVGRKKALLFEKRSKNFFLFTLRRCVIPGVQGWHAGGRKILDVARYDSHAVHERSGRYVSIPFGAWPARYVPHSRILAVCLAIDELAPTVSV